MKRELMKTSIRWATFGLASVLLAACAQRPPLAADANYKLTVLHTNDHHGRFWRNDDGEYGLAARKTLIDGIRQQVKASGGHSLLLDGGDVNMGVPESDTQDAEPDFKGMNMLGYDAMAVGNHEFDKPLSVLNKQQSWIKFPMLSANIYKDGKRLFKPYQVFDFAGLKVAVMGLTTDDTAKMVDPENVRGIEFRKPAAEAAGLMSELKRQAHVVIATTHMGHFPDGKSGISAAGDVEMARAVSGLNLIVGGHSQNPVCMSAENKRNEAYVPGTPCAPDRQNGAWIVQAHEWGKYVGRADFEYRQGELKLLRYELIPVNLKKSVKGADGKSSKVLYGASIAEDPAMLEFLKPYQDKGRAALDVKVGAVDDKLEGDRALVRKQPTNLGVLIATAMKERAKADLAIMNAGGVRDSIKAGDVTYKDVLKVQPFSNTLVYVELTGKEVLDYLNAAAKMSPGSGAFAQFAGVRMTISGGVASDVQIGGAALNPQKTYRMALNNFQANGGDGYPRLSEHPGFVNTGFVDAEVLRGFFAEKPLISAKDFDPGSAVTRR